jgi:hypothetical protein
LHPVERTEHRELKGPLEILKRSLDIS